MSIACGKVLVNIKLPALNREQVRSVDQIAIEQYGMPGVVLMENAGRGAAEIIHRLAPASARPGRHRIAILCGGGNNAGDGYVIARHLEMMGHVTRIIAVVDPASLGGDASVNAMIARRAEIEIRHCREPEQIDHALVDAGVVVDCLLGTGARGPLRGIFAGAVSAANRLDAPRVAIDIPTGLDCDSGVAEDPTFRADHTITFVAAKAGFAKRNAGEFTGAVEIVEIGVPRRLLESLSLGQA